MGKPTNKDRGIAGKKAYEFTVDFSGHFKDMNAFPEDRTVAYFAFEKQKKMSNFPYFPEASYLAAYRVVRNELEIRKIPKVTFVVINDRLTTTFHVQFLEKLLSHDMLDAAAKGVIYNPDRRFENSKLSPRGKSPIMVVGFLEPIVFDTQFIEYNSPVFAKEILAASGIVSQASVFVEVKQNMDILFSDIATRTNDAFSSVGVNTLRKKFERELMIAQPIVILIKDFANITSISEKKKKYEKFKHINKHIASKGDLIMVASEASYSLAVISLKIAIGSNIVKQEIKSNLRAILSEIEKKVSSKVVYFVEGINIVKSVILIFEGQSVFESVEAITISFLKIRVAASLMSGGTMLVILSLYYSSRLLIYTLNEIGKVPSYFVSAKYYDNLKLINSNFKKVISAYLVCMYIEEELLRIGLPEEWGEEQKELYARKLQVLNKSIKEFESRIPENEITSRVFFTPASDRYKMRLGEINNYGNDYSYLFNNTEWHVYRQWIIGYYDIYFQAIVKLYMNSNDYIKEETKRVIQKY